MYVLDLHFCKTNYTNIGIKNNTPLLAQNSVGQNCSIVWWDSLLWISQGWNQHVSWAMIFCAGYGEKIHFQAHFSYWQNSGPCDYRIESLCPCYMALHHLATNGKSDLSGVSNLWLFLQIARGSILFLTSWD